SEYYTVRGEEQDKQFLTGLNSPTWREWAAEAQQWQDDDKDGEGPGPMEVDSVSLEDVRSGESWVSSSFFGGSTGAEVLFSLDGAEATEGTLTQPMTGEALNKGWESTEPVSATHNLSSTGAVAQASPHLWRADLPTALEPGEHTVEVTATDRYGATYTDSFTFTVEDGNGADDADDAADGTAAGETDSEQPRSCRLRVAPSRGVAPSHGVVPPPLPRGSPAPLTGYALSRSTRSHLCGVRSTVRVHTCLCRPFCRISAHRVEGAERHGVEGEGEGEAAERRPRGLSGCRGPSGGPARPSTG